MQIPASKVKPSRSFVSKAANRPFPLREIVDEMKLMLAEGYIKADFSNDEKLAPLDEVSSFLFHHYWFSPTKKGKEMWAQSPRSGANSG